MLIVAWIFSCWSIAAETSKPSCVPSPSDEKNLLSQAYDEFDESTGNGGWRFLPSKCCGQAAKLILKYQQAHAKELKPYQNRVLSFHAGQLHTEAGEHEVGLKEIKAAYASFLPANDEWNLFVSGTLAFLERDMSRLKAIRSEYVKIRGERSSKPYGMDPIEYLIRDLAAGKDYGTCE